MATLLGLLFLLVGVILVHLLARPLRDPTSFLTGLAVVSITWSAVAPGGSPISDVLLALAMVSAIPTVLRRAGTLGLPLATVLGSGLVALAVFLNTVLPSDQGYAQNRYRVVPEVPVEAARTALNVLTGVKLLIALLVIPLLLLVVATTRERLTCLLDLWAASAATSAFIALTDSVHVVGVHGRLLGIPDAPDGRQGGLTNHPVHLATVCVMVLPVILTWLTVPGRRRTWGFVVLVVLSGGTFVTGSRTGILTAGLALVLGSLVQPRVRRLALPILLPLLLFGAGFLLIDSSLLFAFLHKARLTGGVSAGSDYQRLHVVAQAARDIRHRPLLGIGYDVAAEGHSVYLEAVATGGVLGAMGILMAAAGGVAQLKTRVAGRLDVLAVALGTSVVLWLLLDVTENALVDRYMYVPLAFVLAHAALHPSKRRVPATTRPSCATPERSSVSGGDGN